MFTGLVTHRAEILSNEPEAAGARLLTLANPFVSADPVNDGESIAVNGCCLTALVKEEPDSSRLRFFVSAETVSLTTLSSLRPGALVNLERAMQSGERFGGHIVSGHIDCSGEIVSQTPESGSTCVTISYPAEFGALVIPKGSVTVDGVSLTVNTLSDETQATGKRRFTVNIIPHTSEQTGFQTAKTGDTVNLEFDMFAKFALRKTQLETGSTEPVIDVSKTQEIVTQQTITQHRRRTSNGALAEEKYEYEQS